MAGCRSACCCAASRRWWSACSWSTTPCRSAWPSGGTRSASCVGLGATPRPGPPPVRRRGGRCSAWPARCSASRWASRIAHLALAADAGDVLSEHLRQPMDAPAVEVEPASCCWWPLAAGVLTAVAGGAGAGAAGARARSPPTAVRRIPRHPTWRYRFMQVAASAAAARWAARRASLLRRLPAAARRACTAGWAWCSRRAAGDAAADRRCSPGCCSRWRGAAWASRAGWPPTTWCAAPRAGPAW